LLAAHQGGSLLSQTQRDIKPLRDALNAALNYVYSFAVEGTELPRQRRRAAPRKSASAAARSPGAGQPGRRQPRAGSMSRAR
jgi:hypothetical protein